MQARGRERERGGWKEVDIQRKRGKEGERGERRGEGGEYEREREGDRDDSAGGERIRKWRRENE